jgi:ABC-type glycerol-3-phosphate transport system substrate-binding protein
MERMGFKIQQRSMAMATAALAVAAALTSLTAPVATAQDAESWTMPALKEEILQSAVDAVTEAAGADNVTFNVYDREFNQVVYNYTNWVVCGQSPGPDRTVQVNPAKPQTVTLALSRPSTGC